MTKDCFRYDGVVKDIRLIDGRVKIKFAAKTRTQIASMGKYQPNAMPIKFCKIMKIDESQDNFNEAVLQELNSLSGGAPISAFFNIDEDDKTYVQVQI